MRVLLLLLAGVLLAGCYESNGLLLDASASRQPISTYQDWNYGSGDHRYHARLNPRSDGWYNYEEAKINDNGGEGEWKHHTVLLNYLENVNGIDVYVYGTRDDNEKAYYYGVVIVRGDGSWQSVTPSCDPVSADEKWLDADVDAAKRAGATVKSTEAEDICDFADQATLLQAMRNVVSHPDFWSRVEQAAK